MEPLFLLTIPRFNMPDFGSLDEDYLCLEHQLEWYVSDNFFEAPPVRVLEQTASCEEGVEYEYTDTEWEEWAFWIGKLEADLVYIRQDDVYRRCVKIRAEDVLQLRLEEEDPQYTRGVTTYMYHRLERISGYSGILRISDVSPRYCAQEKELLHNVITSNLYYLERSFDTVQEMKADVASPAPVDLRRFFEDVLESK